LGLRVIGAGVGRTGTVSLKLALEHLLGAPCYHMREAFTQPGHVATWHEAVAGREPDWNALFEGYAATVDWPGAAFWRSLSETFPDALVLLSVRTTAAEWFRSADSTINRLLQQRPDSGTEELHAMARDLLRTTFTPIPFDQPRAEAAYERHNAEVRAAISPDRLLEWRVSDGWDPLCARLGLPVPGHPFPHANTAEEFRAIVGLSSRRSWLRRRWQRSRS
jgi:hypothetical protein